MWKAEALLYQHQNLYLKFNNKKHENIYLLKSITWFVIM